MKKSFFVFVLFAVCIILCSFYYLNKEKVESSSREIVLQFITYNGYGNNLYIDNVLTGVQKDYDVTVTSIVNIPYDTVYSVMKTGTDTVSPIVTVSNIGRVNSPDSMKVILEISPGDYLDTSAVGGLGSGQTAQVTFNPFIYTVGTGYYFKAYEVFELDSNRLNDTLRQYSISLPGVERNVLYEEFTSNSSPACANNNPALNNFTNTNLETVTSIRYHTGLLGYDLFYEQNPIQQDARRRYYYIVSVPTTFADGQVPVSIPYGDSNNLYIPYFNRLSKGTPFVMNVIDENVSKDSIKTSIDINIISAVTPGDYVLRINALERYIQTDTAGTNSEFQFFDVFRAAYPDTNGFSISSGKGTYHFEYTYYVEPQWVDSMIYTCAFIQNNSNREVMNSAKGRQIIIPNKIKSSGKNLRGADKLNVSYSYKKNSFSNPLGDSIQSYLNVEVFESYFPPIGWEVFNQDGFITFQQFTGANGPTIGGNKAVIMDFFDYYIAGQRDSMNSKIYTNLLDIDTIRFDYSYAQYTTLGTNIDSLTVKVSSDGGLTFPVEIFRKGGIELSTAPQTTSFFVPQNNTQWKSHKYPLSGIVGINSDFINNPLKFQLRQNYPNPFNPNTIITYELPVSSHVKLKIYDLLGKEILTLVNENQSYGIHEINFDASIVAGGLSSGIYFYRLVTDGFTDTKRMVLVK